MQQRRTTILVVGMGGLLVGLLALQFSWIRALVEARSALFDEQAHEESPHAHHQNLSLIHI